MIQREKASTIALNSWEVESSNICPPMLRRHLAINHDSRWYIGKESNKLEQSEIFGVSKKNTMEYVNHQKKLRKIIEKLTLEKALEIGISRRTFFYLKTRLNKKT